jgi:hypothetical protein
MQHPAAANTAREGKWLQLARPIPSLSAANTAWLNTRLPPGISSGSAPAYRVSILAARNQLALRGGRFGDTL